MYKYFFYSIVFDKLSIISYAFGFDKDKKSSGNISLIPPTFVDTTYNPHAAASKIAIQNASEAEGFRNISPEESILGTSFTVAKPNYIT